MHHNRIIGAVPLVVAMGLAACSVKESPSNATTDTGAAAAAATMAAPQSGPNVVHVVANDYSFEGPAQIPAGLTTLHLMNQGREPH